MDDGWMDEVVGEFALSYTKRYFSSQSHASVHVYRPVIVLNSPQTSAATNRAALVIIKLRDEKAEGISPQRGRC